MDRFASFDGLEIAVHGHAGSGPDTLLMHGFVAYVALQLGRARRRRRILVAVGRRVILYDARGHGVFGHAA